MPYNPYSKMAPPDRHGDVDDMPFEVAHGADSPARALFRYAEDAAAFVDANARHASSDSWVIRYRPSRTPGEAWVAWREGADGYAEDNWSHVAYILWSRVRERRMAEAGDPDDQPPDERFEQLTLDQVVERPDRDTHDTR